MPALSTIEALRKAGYAASLAFRLKQVGIGIDVYANAAEDEYDEVYGIEAGIANTSDSASYVGTIKALVSGEEFVDVDSYADDLFEQGYMYADSDLLNVDSIVEFNRTEGGTKRYKIVAKESVGYTLRNVIRYRLSSLGD